MREFWFALWLVLFFISPAHAIDLSISDPVISNLEVSVIASLSASSNYYLQGVLRSQSSSKYFGETQNNRGDWVDYISSPEKEYIASNFFLTNIQNATWSGQLKLRFKTDDPNYFGPGLYDLKVRRFTGSSSSSAGESNTLVINLTAPLLTPTPSPTPTPIPSLSPSPSMLPSPTPTPTPTPKPSAKPSPSPDLSTTSDGTVAGATTEVDLSGFGVVVSPSPILPGDARQAPILNRSRAKTTLTIGSGLILVSVASFFGYRRYRAIINQ